MVNFGTGYSFGTGYEHPMDRSYDVHEPARDHGFLASDGESTGDVGVRIGDLGMSLMVGPVPNVQAVSAKLRAGTKTMELGFGGAGKGTGQNQTPGFYGKKQRQALAEISRANKVDFTTHSTVGINGMAGMDQQGNFSKANKNFVIQELKRAIDFAADVGFGGPVVVHTGEFQRPIVDAEWNAEGKWKDKFEMFEEERQKVAYGVVDNRTGRVIQEAQKDRSVARPVWNRYDFKNKELWKEYAGKEFRDAHGNLVQPGDYIDYFGNKLDRATRVPRFDEKKGEFEIEQMHWKDLEKEAKEMTEEARNKWREWKRGEITEEEFRASAWGRFVEMGLTEEIKVKPEEAYIIATLETNAAHNRGWALSYGGDFDEVVQSVKKLEKAKEFYQQLEKEIDEKERWKLKQQARSLHASDLVPPDSLFPTQIIDKQIKELRRRMEQAQEAASSQWSQAQEAEETMRYVESADTYALKESFDAYARSGIAAMRQSDELERKNKLKKPLTVAMENLFPEQYGAHPAEMIKLVKGSQVKMVQLLQKEFGYNQKQAEKEAKEHITATIDTGHLNTWRKYWKINPQKSMEENNKEFDQWLLEKFDEMVDAGIVGHIHLSDNYGYHDDHLAPGEGNTPVREIVQRLKKKGYQGELIIEPGADYTTDVSGFHTMMKSWGYLGSPVYGKGAGIASRAWGQVGYGWFGQTQPPYFTFPPYTPSEDWTLWSGVQLE